MEEPKKKKSALANRLSRGAERLSLSMLVAQITPRNRHKEIPTGPAVGKEIVEWTGGRG